MVAPWFDRGNNRCRRRYRDRRIGELVGDFNYLGTVQQHTETAQQEWQPPDPSMAQLRASITERGAAL